MRTSKPKSATAPSIGPATRQRTRYATRTPQAPTRGEVGCGGASRSRAGLTSTLLALAFVPCALHCAGASGDTREVEALDGGGADAAKAPPSATASVPKPPKPQVVDAGSGTCKRSLSMGKITLGATDQGCYINEQVSNRTADLEYECATGGKAEVTFGKQKFSGTIKGDKVDVINVEPFPFAGCNWESTQRIFGDVSTGKLDYTYREKPISSCSPNVLPCSANGKLVVSATDEEEIK